MTVGFHPQPKPRVRALLKQDRVKRKQSIEDRENAKVRARSKGQCEVREATHGTLLHRCRKQARHIHHLLPGLGRRGIRESALAQNKLHVCEDDHSLIHAHILQHHWHDVNDRAGTSYFVRLK